MHQLQFQRKNIFNKLYYICFYRLALKHSS